MLNQIPPFHPGNFANHEQLRRDIREFAVGFGCQDGPQVAVISGLAGIGKTALALVAAHELLDTYLDIRLFAKLDTDPDAPGGVGEILKEFLVDLGVEPESVPDRLEARANKFRALTAGRRVLLVIDGATAAAQVGQLLPGLGASLVIVTEARQLDALRAMVPTRFFMMKPLSIGPARILLARLCGSELIEAEPESIDQIISFCCGLPVALCVVGSMLARAGRHRVDRTLRLLEDERSRLAVLSSDRDLSVTAVFNAALRQLGVNARLCYPIFGLPGTTGEIGVNAVAAALGLPCDDVRSAMSELANASFVDESSDDRFQVKELVRCHAAAIDADDHRGATIRLLFYYLTRAVDAYLLIRRWPAAEPWFSCPPSFETLPDPAAAWHWLEVERGNLRAAIEYAYSIREWQLVVDWCILLWPFYEHGKYSDDLLATHELALDAAGQLGNDGMRSLILTRIGFGHIFRGDLDEAIRGCREASELATDESLRATALEGLGLALLADDELDRARPVLRHNLELARLIGDPRRTALACLHCAKVEQPRRALRLLAEADAVFVAEGDTVNQAKVSLWRGKKRLEQGEFEKARSSLESALAEMIRARRPFDRAEALAALGDLHRAQGRGAQASTWYLAAEQIFADWGFNRQAERMARLRAR